MYGVPAVIFTGGFLAAASTGMAGLVQAGYLTSSILCIGIFFSLLRQLSSLTAIIFRFTVWPWFTSYCSSRKCFGYVGRWLRYPCFPCSCWLSAGSPCAVCWSRCYRRYCRQHPGQTYHCHRAPSDGGGSAFRRRSRCSFHLNC